MAKAKQLSKAKAKTTTKEWTQLWTLVSAIDALAVGGELFIEFINLVAVSLNSFQNVLHLVPTTAATTTRKGGDITGTTQGPGVAPAQTIPIRLRELQKHPGQQAKMSVSVGVKHMVIHRVSRNE